MVKEQVSRSLAGEEDELYSIARSDEHGWVHPWAWRSSPVEYYARSQVWKGTALVGDRCKWCNYRAWSRQILHIDFGDCFEVAMHRDKFPERIPFRLTRMIINAMEVSGIEGNFRSTCERVMAVLRDNKDSLMAMLEAFVYDPLISWKLLTGNKEGESPVC